MADVFPVIPEELPAQVAESIGRSPAFVFHEDGRSGSFPLVDGALVERQGVKAVKQWLELMLRQKPGAIPIYRTSGTTQHGGNVCCLYSVSYYAIIYRGFAAPAAGAKRKGHLRSVCQ